MVHKAALNDLRDPMQELAQQQQQQATDAAWAGTAAQKAMVQVDQQTEEAVRKMGQAHATATQLLEAESNEQPILTGEFNGSIEAMDRKTAAQNTLLSSYDASKGSLEDYLRSVEASDMVQATSIAGTLEQARQTAVLTDALKRQAEAQADITIARKAYSQSLDLETIKAETEALGQDSDAVSVQMAVLKERNALLENGADLTSKASQADLDNVAALQTATNAYQHQQDTLNELTRDISSAADTLSSSFTEALVNASDGGVTFKSAMHETAIVLAAALLKRPGFEGFRLKPYVCPAGCWTIGHGSRWLKSGQPVTARAPPISEDAAASLLLHAVMACDVTLSRLVRVPLSDVQRAALLSWQYNVGPPALESSTLLRKLNVGDYAGAADELLR